MAARKSSRVNRKYKTRYRVQNWPEYERGLRARGDVTVWVSDEAVAAWTPPPSGRRGGQRQYSNLAILTSLTPRMVFHLPLRQTEGFVGSLLRLMGLDLKAPDHSTLSRRGEHVEVPPLCRDHDGPIHLAVDSTGLKVSGAGDSAWAALPSAAASHAARRRRGSAARVSRLGGTSVDARYWMPCTPLIPASSGSDRVDMRVPPQVRGRGVDGSDHAGAYGVIGGLGDELAHGLPYRATQLAEKLTAMEEERSQELRHFVRHKQSRGALASSHGCYTSLYNV